MCETIWFCRVSNICTGLAAMGSGVNDGLALFSQGVRCSAYHLPKCGVILSSCCVRRLTDSLLPRPENFGRTAGVLEMR